MCVFCDKGVMVREVASRGTVFAIADKYPVTPGHMLVIPKRHAEDWFAMSDEERKDALELIGVLRELILHDDPSVTGFNVGMNCGLSAGQTVIHAHIHLIPRRDGDSPDPRGGIRGCIPDKKSY